MATLEHTPTWAVAAVCFFFITISIILEHLIHLLTGWLKRNRKKALNEAVERLKSELMLLGFLSLLLAVTQVQISRICISKDAANTMLPCRKQTSSSELNLQIYEHISVNEQEDHLIIFNFSSTDANSHDEDLILWHARRLLAENETSATDSCTSRNMVSLVTQHGIHQLHIFIFVLAVMQIMYSVITMGLGRAKMRRWKAWEKETQTTEYQVANDPNRFRYTRETTFARRHMKSCTQTTVQLWIKCFFRQFFHSVAKVDYFTLRHSFIAAHLSPDNNSFNFQKYIQKSLEEDFKEIVSISPLMWLFVVIFMLVDVHGWHVYLWMSFVPLLIILILGTKLEVIVTRMALHDLKSQNNVIKGAPLVQPNDNLFWFGKPRFVLTLLHYTLFVNAFEFAFFVWVSIQFGVDSCYHEQRVVIAIRVVLAVAAQVLCSYITLPLYALVTQMGSHYKSKALEEQTAQIIKQWHAEVRDRRRKQEQYMQSPRASLPADWSPRLPPLVNRDIDLCNLGEISSSEERNDTEQGEAGPSGGATLDLITPRHSRI
ncbi:Mlo-related protein [Dillenia turbinata]|uniref:MLO-like protein n=1 Tax=Dillenia turbinata TaxID=194707 RepID=A0AAN8W3X7_9MAGN